jgi:hypothetical protein
LSHAAPPGQQQPEHVAEVVPGVGEQGNGVRQNAEDGLDSDET